MWRSSVTHTSPPSSSWNSPSPRFLTGVYRSLETAPPPMTFGGLYA